MNRVKRAIKSFMKTIIPVNLAYRFIHIYIIICSIECTSENDCIISLKRTVDTFLIIALFAVAKSWCIEVT